MCQHSKKAGATLHPTAGAEPAPRASSSTTIDDVSGSRKSIPDAFQCTSMHPQRFGPRSVTVLICHSTFAESVCQLTTVKVPRRSSRTVTGSDLSDKGAVGTIVHKEICDNCKKLSPVQQYVIKNDGSTTVREQLTHDYNRNALGGTALQIRTQHSKVLETRTVSKQDHVRSCVALACLSIRRRQLSLQRARWLESNRSVLDHVSDAINAAPSSQRD